MIEPVEIGFEVNLIGGSKLISDIRIIFSSEGELKTSASSSMTLSQINNPVDSAGASGRLLLALCIALSLLLPLLSGCSTTPKRMSFDDINRMRNVAVVAKLDDRDLKVLDITGIKKKEQSRQYGGVMFGALGGAIEALIIEGIANNKIHSMIGGSIDPVRESVADFDAGAAFFEVAQSKLPDKIKSGRTIQNVTVLKEGKIPESAGSIVISGDDKNIHPDTLLTIEYRYGLGALVESRPVPAIVANISVVNIPENREMMRDSMVSYSCSENNYTLADYAGDKGKIFRQCFSELVESFCQGLASSYF